MPYTDRLKEFAEWYRQLWAESLGKRVDRSGRTVHTGPTPVGAIGVTDQHSQVQLFMEGPYDKVITFATVDDLGEDVAIPPRADLPPDLAYLPGHTLGELLRAEYEATSAALSQMGRMNCTLRLPDLSAAHDRRGHHVLPARHRLRRGLVWHRSVRSARRRAGQAAHVRGDGTPRATSRRRAATSARRADEA